MKNSQQLPRVRFWRAPAVSEMELIHASYAAHAFPRHMHEEYVIGVMVRGVEALHHGGTTHTAPASSLILINPGEWHSNYAINESGFAYRMLYPPADVLQRVASERAGRAEDAPYLRGPVVAEDELTRRLLLQFHAAVEENASALEQESRFLAAVGQLIARHTGDPSPLSRARPDRSYVKTVRDAVGASPFHFQTQVRVARAKRMLRAGRSIADAALEVGFVDQSHLTRHFKRIVGVTPGQYVRDRKNLQDTSPGTWL